MLLEGDEGIQRRRENRAQMHDGLTQRISMVRARRFGESVERDPHRIQSPPKAMQQMIERVQRQWNT